MKNDNLKTPKYIWGPLGPFDLDPCSGEHTNIAVTNWWDGRGECGLEREWFGFVWCNPPFSQKHKWIDKMLSHKNGILLLPERGSAPWFGPLAQASEYHFVSGKKINFEGGSSSNNVGSAFFLFGDLALFRMSQSGLPGHLNQTRYFKPRV